VGLCGAPEQAASLWPWKLTPLLAQATGAWLISLGVAAGHSLLERDARRLLPAAVGSILLALLQAIALARYPHRFDWGSAAGTIYLVFLCAILLTGAAMLLTGAAGRASLPGRNDWARQGRPVPRRAGSRGRPVSRAVSLRARRAPGPGHGQAARRSPQAGA